MIQTDIRDVVRLENTRPLYSAVENLHRGFLMGHNTPADIDLRPEAIKSFCTDELTAAEKPNHPYANFRQFLCKDFALSNSHADDKALADTAANLLCLYDALDCLGSESLPQEEYPDVFEYLCNSMRRIMDSSVCYLLYSQRNHIELLSTSVFPESMVSLKSPEEKPDRPLTENDFHRIRRHIHRIRSGRAGAEDKGSWSIADTVYHLDMGELNLITLVIDFPRYPKEQWKDEFLYLIFRQDKPFPTPQSGDWDRLILNLRNVLFLRNQLLEQCMCKLYILMAGQRSYQYVKRLSEPGKPLRILHLTDLHISEDTEEPMKQFLKLVEKLPQVDLLAITGDVIQGSNSAGTMEDRYRQAARFIRQIAAKLWSTEGEKLVRTDWFKRILIVPGNHDYATMNDLQSMSLPGEPRATGLGYPARKDGGPMVKFAYYIKFLCDLLDLDITELVRNDLNESRRYLRMGLTVYGLNTVSEIGPLRTNKVSLNLDAVLPLVKAREPRNRFNLILSHHGPCYRLDYLMDRYGIWIKELSDETQQTWISKFANALEQFDSSPKTPEDQKTCSDILSKLQQEILKYPVQRNSYDLLRDISTAIQALKEHPGFNERLSLLHHTLLRDRQMMEHDEKLLDDAFGELMRRIGFHMCLSGHTHAYRSDFYRDPLTKVKTQILCVEGDRMFDGDKIHYAIVEIDDQKHQVRWTGYPTDSSQPPLVSTF